MKVFDGLENLQIEQPCAVTVGKFDGFHLGHQALLNAAKKAAEQGLHTCVIMINFSTPGFSVKSDRNAGRNSILTYEEACEFLETLGIDILIRIQSDSAFFSMKPEEFLTDFLIKRLQMKAIICGQDFRFGKDREGDTEMLSRAATEYGFTCEIVPKMVLSGEPVSSSRIRSALKDGEIGKANEALGRPYSISGEVIHGISYAGGWGFPTANLIPDAGKILPKKGVYQAYSWISGEKVKGILNLGTKPTVTDGKEIILEIHFIGWSGNLYGEKLTVYFERFLRPEKRFRSIEALKKQIARDISAVRAGRAEDVSSVRAGQAEDQ